MVWCVVLSAGLSALNASEMTALVREASNWAFRLDLQERTRHPCLSPSPAAPDAEPINFCSAVWSASWRPPLLLLCFLLVCCRDFALRPTYLALLTRLLTAGIEQVRANELGMLEDETTLSSST